VSRKAVHLLYFAAFHDATGCREENWQTDAATAAELYGEISARYGFPFDRSVLRVAKNDEVVSWSTELADGDLVAFLAPFAGG